MNSVAVDKNTVFNPFLSESDEISSNDNSEHDKLEEAEVTIATKVNVFNPFLGESDEVSSKDNTESGKIQEVEERNSKFETVIHKDKPFKCLVCPKCLSKKKLP